MGTTYIVDPRTGDIPWDQTLALDMYDRNNPDNDKDSVALTDGKNTVWAYKTGDKGTNFEVYGSNNPDFIFSKLEEKFEVEFVDEHNEDFRYLAGPDFSTVHHRHGVDFEVALFKNDEDGNTLGVEWRIDGELVESEEIKLIEDTTTFFRGKLAAKVVRIGRRLGNTTPK